MRADVIPQLADAREVLEAIDVPDDVALSVLIPNERGLDNALALRDRFHEINVFMSATETPQHGQRQPLRRGVAGRAGGACSAAPARPGLRCEARDLGRLRLPLRGPRAARARVRDRAPARSTAGAQEIGFGDTTGMANPAQVRAFFPAARDALGDDVELTAHFHNTRGQGLANVLAALDAGVSSFESSFGELGGCPVPQGRDRQRRHRGRACRCCTRWASRPASRSRRCSRRRARRRRCSAGRSARTCSPPGPVVWKG